jgi:hypothetical protein
MIPSLILIMLAVFGSIGLFIAALSSFSDYGPFAIKRFVICGSLCLIMAIGSPIWLCSSYYSRAIVKEEIALVESITSPDGSITQVVSFSDSEIYNVSKEVGKVLPEGSSVKRGTFEESNLGISWSSHANKTDHIYTIIVNNEEKK